MFGRRRPMPSKLGAHASLVSLWEAQLCTAARCLVTVNRPLIGQPRNLAACLDIARSRVLESVDSTLRVATDESALAYRL